MTCPRSPRRPPRLVAAAAQLGRALVLAAAALAAAGCGGRAASFTQQRIYAMGTWVDVALEAPPRQAAAALGDIERMLRRIERDDYAWAPEGELARLNLALAEGRSATVSPALAALLAKARKLSAASGGAFDPGVGALVELWGFNDELAPPSAPPAPAAIRDWLAGGAGIRDLAIEGTRVTSANRAVKIDLGGIAKGAAVDEAIALLRAHGIRDALVNAGGNLRAIGTHGGRPWRIGIKAPRGAGVLGVLELADGEAASTSGDYERYYDRGKKRYHHLLDPRTGYPAEGTEAVTVVAPNATDADAASTALFVAGAKGWRGAAEALGIELALRVDTQGAVEVTDALARRIEWTSGEHAAVGS